jgi:putative membrane protein
MTYLWLKSFHIVGVVAWFAALFYLVRLFIYHVEAAERSPAERAVLEPQFALMERRLYRIIGTPAMWLTVLTAIGMLLVQPGWLREGWLWAKLVLVAALLVYHIWCGRAIERLAAGTLALSSRRLRALNEVPTLILVVVVLLVVFKSQLPITGLVLTVVGLGLLLAAGIRLYARVRRAERRPGTAV